MFKKIIDFFIIKYIYFIQNSITSHYDSLNNYYNSLAEVKKLFRRSFYPHPIFYVNLKQKKILLANEKNLDLNKLSMRLPREYISSLHYITNEYKVDDYNYDHYIMTYEYTPLSPIYFVNNKKELIWYLENGANPYYLEDLGGNYSLFAILSILLKDKNNSNRIEVLEELLKRNIYCNTTEIIYFIYMKEIEVLKLIIKYSYLKKIDYIDFLKEFCINNAITIQMVECLSHCIKLDSPKTVGYRVETEQVSEIYINQCIKYNKIDELFVAVYNGDLEKVKLILEKGNYKIKDELGYNLYHYCYDVDILKLLFKANLDLDLMRDDYPLSGNIFEKEHLNRTLKKQLQGVYYNDPSLKNSADKETSIFKRIGYTI